MGWNQTQYDANVSGGLIPTGCYLYGGSSDTVAEDMSGRHLASTTGVVRSTPDTNPISVWLGADTITPYLSTTITTDARGVLPVFAVAGGVAPIWADFGQGLVAVRPWDTDKRLVATTNQISNHAAGSDPHGDRAYAVGQVATLRPVASTQTTDLTGGSISTFTTWVDFSAGMWPAITTTVPSSGILMVTITAHVTSNPNTTTSTLWANWRGVGGGIDTLTSAGTMDPRGIRSLGGVRQQTSKRRFLNNLTPGATVTLTPVWYATSSSGDANTVISFGQLIVEPG